MNVIPLNISDLKYQSNVITLKQGEAPETAANRFFHELFDPKSHVFTRLLFQEDGQKVYECYQDAGSSEYLYLISK